MSKLHAVFAWGCVGAIIAGTTILYLVGRENWQWLAIIFTAIPLLSFVLFLSVKIPHFKNNDGSNADIKSLMKNKTLWICVICIFLGGSAECSMSNWLSSYLELSLGIDKIWGDIFGFAMFSTCLGLGRTLYAKMGKNIEKTMFIGAFGASVCYVTAAITQLPLLGLIGCAFTGYFVAMLWPGSLIISSKKIPSGGLFIYAMMAAGGDLGASIGPQLVGIVTDNLSQNSWIIRLAETLLITPEQLSMRCAILVGALFPIAAIFVCRYLYKTKQNI
jgi:fucose permease